MGRAGQNRVFFRHDVLCVHKLVAAVAACAEIKPADILAWREKEGNSSHPQLRTQGESGFWGRQPGFFKSIAPGRLIVLQWTSP